MNKPVTLEGRSLPRIYAHYHRVLIELLENLVEDPEVRTLWLAQEGHTRNPEGEKNLYNKAIYFLEDFRAYQEMFAELELVQAEGVAHSGVKPAGLLLPQLVEGVSHVRLIKHESWASSLVERDVALNRLEDFIELTRANLAEFERYASREDPKRKKLELELKTYLKAKKGLVARADIPLRQRVVSVKHKARLYQPPYQRNLEERVTELYIRDVGLIISGPNSLNLKLEYPNKRKRRTDKVKLEPLVRFGRVALFDEEDWQIAKIGGS